MARLVWNAVSYRYFGYVPTPTHPFELAAFASAAVPTLRITELRAPQVSDEAGSMTGFSDAQGNSWLAVSPSRDFTHEQLDNVLTLLGYLTRCSASEELPFRVFQPEGIAGTDSGIVAVFRDPGGNPGNDFEILTDGLYAASLGRALASVHNLPSVRIAQCGVEVHSISELRDSVRILVKAGGRYIPASLRRRWLAAADHEELWTFSPVPIHSALSPRSVWQQDGAVLAITDFWDMRIGDPATDLAWVLPLSDDSFISRFQSAYSSWRNATDLHLMTRAQLYSELALARWLGFGIDTGDSQVVEEAKAMLTELAESVNGSLLTPHTEPVAPIHFTAAEDPLLHMQSDPEVDLDELAVVDLEDQLAATPYSPEEAASLLTEDLSDVIDDILATHQEPDEDDH